MNFTIYLISLFQFKDLGICSIEYLVIHKELAFISRSAPAEICHAAASKKLPSNRPRYFFMSALLCQLFSQKFFFYLSTV